MDKDEFTEHYSKQERRIKSDHAAARHARNPETALKEMSGSITDGFAYSAEEVLNHMRYESMTGRDIDESATWSEEKRGAPVNVDLLGSTDEREDYFVSRVKSHLDVAAQRQEDYVELPSDNADFDESMFAYVGDEDLDI